MKIIAIAGIARSGKTTLANEYIADHCHCSAITFGAPIRNALKILGINRAENPQLYRRMAQMIGETARASDPDHFIKIHRNELEFRKPSCVVIDDLRYFNELEYLKSLPGEKTFVYVDSRSRINTTGSEYQHESERFAMRFDPKQHSDFRVLENASDLPSYIELIKKSGLLCQ